MRILTRYILRSHTGPFLFALTALTSILLINVIARQLENLAGKGLPTSVFVNVFLFSLPHIIALTVPMAVLVAVLFTFSQLSADNEIAALKASGVNLHRLMVPVLFAGIGVAVVMVFFYDRVLPEANHRLANLYIDVARKAPTLQLREQVLNLIPTTDGSGQYYLQAATIDPATSRMRDVVIYDLSRPGVNRTIYADSGRMAFNQDRTDLFLHLNRGWINEADAANPTRFSRMFFGQELLRIRGIGNKLEHSQDTYRSDREMTVAMLWQQVGQRRKDLTQVEDQMRKTEQAGLKQTLEGVPRVRLPQPILVPGPGQTPGDMRRVLQSVPDEVVRSTALQLRVLKDRAATTQDVLNSYLVEFYKKFAIPFASIVFVLIGAPLALRFPRGGTGTVIAISLAIFGIYYVGLIGGETLSDRGDLSPFTAMWGTNIIFLLLSVYGVATIGHERSNARAGTWSDLFQTARDSVSGLWRRRPRPLRVVGR